MKKIVVDSSCDLLILENIAPDTQYSRVPLKISVGEEHFVDDDALNVREMLDTMYAYEGKTSSACPSPEDWAREFRQAQEVYCITISGNISGCYGSAVVGRQMVLEEDPTKKIFLLNSFSTGPEMTLLVWKLNELLRQGLSYEEICLAMGQYRKHTKLLFTLCSLDNLVKNGRVGKVSGLAAKVLNIRVVGQASDEGQLELLHKCRGQVKTLETILQEMCQRGYRGARVVIGHVFNSEGAQAMKALIHARFPGAPILLMPLRGLCSYYAEMGGLLVGYEI